MLENILICFTLFPIISSHLTEKRMKFLMNQFSTNESLQLTICWSKYTTNRLQAAQQELALKPPQPHPILRPSLFIEFLSMNVCCLCFYLLNTGLITEISTTTKSKQVRRKVVNLLKSIVAEPDVRSRSWTVFWCPGDLGYVPASKNSSVWQV